LNTAFEALDRVQWRRAKADLVDWKAALFCDAPNL